MIIVRKTEQGFEEFITRSEIAKMKYPSWLKDPHFWHWMYELKLGDEAYLTSQDLPTRLKQGETIGIRSGEFALLITEETVHLDHKTMGFISLKFKYKKYGLINISGFHVDPGYKGKLIFSVFNAGPNDILIKKGDPLFMIFFQQLDGEARERKGEAYTSIPIDMISGIKGRSTTLAHNAERIDRLESHIRTLTWVVGLAIPLVVVLTKAFP